MLDQEIASAIKFIIENSGNPTPYYWNIPQDFVTPAVFFPQPEVRSSGDTLSTYALEFSWFIKFFGKDTAQAHSYAFATLTALQQMKNVVPLINEDGDYINRPPVDENDRRELKRVFRLQDPRMRPVADGAVMLTLMWDSRRPYYQREYEKIMSFHPNMFVKDSFESAVNQMNGGLSNG